MIKIVVVNGHCLGEYCDVAALPTPGATVTAHDRRYNDDGGKGSNVAVALGRLGAAVGFVGKVGDDMGGRLGREWMEEAGVDLTHYLVDSSVKTNSGLCVVAGDGSNIILNFFDDANSIRPDELDECLPLCRDADFCIVGFEIPWKTALHAARRAGEMGMRVFLNPSPLEPGMRLGDLSFVDTMVINETEAAMLLDRPVSEITDFAEAAQAVRMRYHPRCVILTLGGNGSIASTEEGFYKAEALPVPCVDTVGAGDGFLAALTWRISEGDSLPDAMQWASYYAAYICCHVGTIRVYPTLPQLRAFLTEHGISLTEIDR